ncbi:unnamed protein product [Ilex paraguariensis]|uniref:VQ domain-containing protein n=1 Tax=Ilex paraguariensis TaxID=185542 RepID=A0ABC8TEL3_9AQUA
MDSGNSGSMQSSSGGDEEYDSRTESISPFFNPSGHYGSSSISNPQSLPHHQSHPPTMFDPPSHNLEAFSQSPTNPNTNPLYNNLDLVWPRGLRSEANFTEFGNLAGLPSSSQSVLGSQGLGHGSFSSSPSMTLQSVDGNAARASQPPDQTHVVKNPKKRTRASRRAPTTVLTTDTSNFRQMVQEFTGIPTAPFSASPYSRRLDLFGSSSTMRSGHLDTLGPLYPLRPSAQKVQISPFVSSSSSSPLLNSNMVDAIPASNMGSSTSTSIAGISNTLSSQNYHQLPSDIGLSKQPPQNLLSMQNQILTFQSLLQSPGLPPQLKHPLSNTPIFGTKSQGSSSIPLDELGLSHENVNTNLSGFPSHGSSDGAHVRRENSPTRWREGMRLNHGGQEHLGPFHVNNGNSQRFSSYKLHSSASTSDFHAEKGLENVSSRGEGTVESWICPSD